MFLLVAVALADPFTDWLAAPDPVADGFRLPSTEAAARGRVSAVDVDRVEVTHTWYENHERRTLVVRYEGLQPGDLRVGQVVAQGAPLGAGAPRVSFLVDGAPTDARSFVDRHATVPVPQEEPELLLVHHDTYEARLYRRGVEQARYPISLGQGVGQKRERGDNRTPKGMYFVVARSTGPFTGPEGPWYGGRWIKISYPNPWDAAYGAARGWVDAATVDRVREAWARRGLPPQDTRLGSGIGLHGWIAEWPLDGPRHLSWGCVVFEPSEVRALYDQLPVGAMVVIF